MTYEFYDNSYIDIVLEILVTNVWDIILIGSNIEKLLYITDSCTKHLYPNYILHDSQTSSRYHQTQENNNRIIYGPAH